MNERKAYQWTRERLIAYPQIMEVDLSPDGRHIVYTVQEPLMTETRSEFITHLYGVAAEGGEPVQLTFGEHSDRCPKWSPDGRYIAFLSTRGEGDKASLYVMRASGGEAWPLTSYQKSDESERTAITQVAWSPSGDRLAFLMPEPPTEEKVTAQKTKDDAILWDVDFDFVHLYVVPFAVGPRELPEVRQLTHGRFHLIDFAWLPDGERIAITHRPTPVDNDWPKTRLALVPTGRNENGTPCDQDALKDVAPIFAWGGTPRVSPDGAWIACITGEDPPPWGFTNRVALYPTEGGAPRMLAWTPDGQCAGLIGWSADGQWVYTCELNGVNSQVWASPVTGEPGHAVTETQTQKGPFAINRNGQIAFVGQDFDQPNTLYLWDPADAAAPHAIITPTLPPDWPDAPLPHTEVLTWHAHDGMPIEGIVIYPLAYQPGQRYPLVVQVHGGPAGVYQRQYLGLASAYNSLGLAERGFCILRVNPRGSSGYGKDFRFANYSDWGKGDYQDIMAGVDVLIARGIVDPARMGIVGWSYGGYMTSWVITQTDRFKAACVGAGVTNLMSFNGTADIPGFIPDYFSTEFWDDLLPYRAHSAMFNMKGVTTPTLILHGEKDIRVPLSQGRELYNALKRQGVPAKMIIYPRQGHSVAEPRLRMDLQQRITQWLEQWVLEEENK